MWNKKTKIILFFLVIVSILAITFKLRQKNTSAEVMVEISPVRGNIESIISTTGTVLPKNRLEIKPPVGGRAEEILVAEGDNVKAGQVIAWISSTERAALLDAARGKGEETLKYWEETYKPIPLISPIDGEVIVAKTQPGQTIAAVDPVIVLSDHLIVRAQVDETDIGKIKAAQAVVITLDAYPETKIGGLVEHIYYESKVVNNVTIYEVDVVPQKVPEFFRSGMSASLDFKEESRENVLLLPVEAVYRQKDEAWVLVRQEGSKEPAKRVVKVGISDDKNTEIISGVGDNEKVLIRLKKYTLPTANSGSNPFMPGRRR